MLFLQTLCLHRTGKRAVWAGVGWGQGEGRRVGQENTPGDLGECHGLTVCGSRPPGREGGLHQVSRPWEGLPSFLGAPGV